MTKKRAIQVLEEIEYKLSLITNGHSKASNKAWDDVIEAVQVILQEIKK